MTDLLTHDIVVHNVRVFEALKAAEQALANLGRKEDAAALQSLRWKADAILGAKHHTTT